MLKAQGPSLEAQPRGISEQSGKMGRGVNSCLVLRTMSAFNQAVSVVSEEPQGYSSEDTWTLTY